MIGKIKRRSLRCGGRPKADFGSLFTSVIAPAFNAAGSIADESINNNKTITNSIVNNNTTIPSDPTKTPTMRLGGRKKCWIGATIGAATSIAGSLFGNSAQKREMRRQQSIRDWQAATQEAANMTSILNNSRDYQEDYLRQFRTAARLGKTLGAKGIYITDGGDATKIGNNTYLLRGGSHEDVNESGQTGIGINVGGNEVEAEGGEVAQKKNGALRIFSAQPILGNGMSPAQAILRGYNKDKVFSQQQAFKKRNGFKDDGSRLRNGGLTSKNRGSSKHPYPSVSSKDFAGGARSYPIPTKADAVDALRLAGLHGRSDVRSKVYSKYPSLRPKAAFGDWVRTNRDDNALADLLYESGLFDRESWNTMLRDIHEFTGMGANPYNTDDNIDAVMVPAFSSSSSRILSQLAKSPEASYTLKQVLGLPTKEMIRKRIAGDIAKRIGITRAARQSSNFRNYNIARMQAANAEASFSPFANQVRYAEGKPVLVNTNGYYTTAGNTISRNAKNMTSGANPFLYVPRTSNKVLEGLDRIISNAKQGAKNVGQKVGNKFKGTPGQKLSDAYYDLTPMQRAKLKSLTLAATLSIPADYFVESQNGRNNKSTPVQKDAHGKPISQYKGNTTKGNYQLHDGETRTINGIKYTRRGNAIINHKTNVAYIYDKNGNYTGKADYSKVGNFNQAFDAARAAGRSQFIYRAGKYNNYSTIKETDAKKERLNRIVGARRVARRMGGISLRPKALGGMYVPFNKRYTSIYDAPDYDSDYNGGNVLGNGEVTITAKRIKPTFMKPNNDAMNLIKVPKEEVPYIPQKHNRSRTIFSGGDYLGLGIDTLAALSTGLVNYNTAGKYTLPDRAPIIQASKLPTTYNVNPEIEEVKRYRDRLTGQTFNNTSSSVAALNRSSAINLDAISNLSKLWATKENEENKMLTEDAKNQQTIAAQNAQNELARQSEIARIKNEAIQAKGDALNVGLSGLSQAWTNFWTAGRTAYEDDQARRAMIASSKEATPTRLSEIDFDLSPDILASLYRTSKDDRTKRFYLSRLSPKQRQKYGIN